MWWMASSASIISDNKPSHLRAWLGCFWMRSMLLHATFVSNRCSSDACIKTVQCMMLLLVHYHAMRSEEQVCMNRRLKFTTQDYKKKSNMIFLLEVMKGNIKQWEICAKMYKWSKQILRRKSGNTCRAIRCLQCVFLFWCVWLLPWKK